MSWFAGKFLGLDRWLWLIVAVVIVIGLVVWSERSERADDVANQEIGATKVENKNLEETLERTEKANEVRASATPGSRVIYDECLRSARTPANCERFLPDRQDDLDRAGTRPVNP